MKDLDELKSPDLPVKDVMSRNPVVIRKDKTVKNAADLIRDTDIGSLVVVDEEDSLTGIITEMDMVKKVISSKRNPEKVTVEDVMSTPVHTIKGDNLIQEAAEVMSEMGIRRLPVVNEEEKMIGIITENDILEIAPTLIGITREYNRIHEIENIEEYQEPVKRETSGYCESCGVYSDSLTSENGQLLCPECK